MEPVILTPDILPLGKEHFVVNRIGFLPHFRNSNTKRASSRIIEKVYHGENLIGFRTTNNSLYVLTGIISSITEAGRATTVVSSSTAELFFSHGSFHELEKVTLDSVMFEIFG